MKGILSLEWEEITILVDHDWCGRKRLTEEVTYELNFEKHMCGSGKAEILCKDLEALSARIGEVHEP